MFNILYRCPRTVARHEHGPLHESRRLYLEHLSVHEAALHTLRGAAGIIYCAAIWMKLDDSSPVERKEVECAAKRWAHHSYRNASCRSPEQTDRKSRQTTCNWLRFAGRLRRGTVIVAFNPVREVKNVLCKMRNIHARKLVPSRNDENPFKALA